MPDQRTSPRSLEYSTVVLAVLAVIAALYLGRGVLIPVTFGVVLAATLVPVVRWLERCRLPAPAAATIAILAALAVLATVATALEPPVQDFVDELPKSIAAAQPRINALGESLRRLTGTPAPRRARPTAGSAGTIARPPSAPPPGASDAGPTASPSATVREALGLASSALGDVVEVVLLALFILAAGRAWQDKVTQAVAVPERQRAIIDTAEEMRRVITRYLLVDTVINIGQGAVMGVALWLLGYPDALLWGVLTFLLEFIPYLGGMAMIGLLLVAGLAADRSFIAALVGPAVYLAVTTIQNNLVSPVAYGKEMRLNPTALLLALMVWWELWGVAGAFLAVPIVAMIQVVARRTPSLKAVAVFLSD